MAHWLTKKAYTSANLSGEEAKEQAAAAAGPTGAQTPTNRQQASTPTNTTSFNLSTPSKSPANAGGANTRGLVYNPSGTPGQMLGGGGMAQQMGVMGGGGGGGNAGNRNVLLDKITSLETQQLTLISQLMGQKEEIARFHVLKGTMEKENKALLQSKESLEREVDALTGAKNSLELQRDSLTLERNTLNRTVAERDRRIAELEGLLAEAREQIAKLTTERAWFEKRHVQGEKKQKEHEATIALLKTENEHLREGVEKLRQIESDVLPVAGAKERAMIDQMQVSLVDLKNELEDSLRKQKAIERENEEIQEELHRQLEASSDQLQKLHDAETLQRKTKLDYEHTIHTINLQHAELVRQMKDQEAKRKAKADEDYRVMKNTNAELGSALEKSERVREKLRVDRTEMHSQLQTMKQEYEHMKLTNAALRNTNIDLQEDLDDLMDQVEYLEDPDDFVPKERPPPQVKEDLAGLMAIAQMELEEVHAKGTETQRSGQITARTNQLIKHATMPNESGSQSGAPASNSEAALREEVSRLKSESARLRADNAELLEANESMHSEVARVLTARRGGDDSAAAGSIPEVGGVLMMGESLSGTATPGAAPGSVVSPGDAASPGSARTVKRVLSSGQEMARSAGNPGSIEEEEDESSSSASGAQPKRMMNASGPEVARSAGNPGSDATSPGVEAAGSPATASPATDAGASASSSSTGAPRKAPSLRAVLALTRAVVTVPSSENRPSQSMDARRAASNQRLQARKAVRQESAAQSAGNDGVSGDSTPAIAGGDSAPGLPPSLPPSVAGTPAATPPLANGGASTPAQVIKGGPKRNAANEVALRAQVQALTAQCAELQTQHGQLTDALKDAGAEIPAMKRIAPVSIDRVGANAGFGGSSAFSVGLECTGQCREYAELQREYQQLSAEHSNCPGASLNGAGGFGARAPAAAVAMPVSRVTEFFVPSNLHSLQSSELIAVVLSLKHTLQKLQDSNDSLASKNFLATHTISRLENAAVRTSELQRYILQQEQLFSVKYSQSQRDLILAQGEREEILRKLLGESTDQVLKSVVLRSEGEVKALQERLRRSGLEVESGARALREMEVYLRTQESKWTEQIHAINSTWAGKLEQQRNIAAEAQRSLETRAEQVFMSGNMDAHSLRTETERIYEARLKQQLQFWSVQ
jgi:hypothetical protein